MRVGAVVQARMSSRRLPGKVLTLLAGRPALDWVLERLEHAEGLDAIVVATSTDESDDPVAAFCAERGTACHRGPLDDVAQRLLDAARRAELDVFVRVNGDSPLLDQRLVDRGVAMARESACDLVTNVRPRSFPPGQSVEVVRTEALARAIDGPLSAGDREHVTGPLYGDGFSRLRFEADPARTEPSFTLDTPEDRVRLDGILRTLERPHWDYSWDELL